MGGLVLLVLKCGLCSKADALVISVLEQKEDVGL
jgi:hypothetical protein